MFWTAPPRFTSVADVHAHVCRLFHCVEAPPDYRPPMGWHTIRVANGSHSELPTPDSLRTWATLFDVYANDRSGDLLYWKDVVRFDRETREITARFAIVTK